MDIIFLWISVLWSFKTAAITSINIRGEEKDFFPVKAKIILGFRALLVYIVRVGCFIAYFAPFLGLLDCMNHYHMEQILLANSSRFKAAETTDILLKSTFEFYRNRSSIFHYWNNETNQPESVPLSSIFRTDPKDPTKPINSTVYTSIGLGQAYYIFCLGLLFYSIVLFIAKTSTNEDFRIAPLFNKLQHITWAINTPELFKDWDLTNRGREELVKRWWDKLRELTVMQLLHTLSNMCLLIPLVSTGNKMKKNPLVGTSSV